MGTKANGNSYHHGDLRNALIIAAAELIEERGSLDFALVDAARRAGVSSAAPYRHFTDKDALLQAVAELGFLALTESAKAVAEEFPVKDEASIIAQGKNYIRFVSGHPEFYELMWGDHALRSTPQGEGQLRASGFYVLVETVRAWCVGHDLADQDALELAIKLWSMAHGLACIEMNHLADRFMPGVDIYALLEGSTHTFLEGLLKNG